MSTASAHDRNHSELVCLYALKALPPSELRAVEAQIATCTDCRDEIEALRPVVDAFAGWPTDLLRPSAPLWERLARRIAAESGDEPILVPPQRWADARWKNVAPGIDCMLLATDRHQDRVSMLVRLAPGVEYPPHKHAGIEEVYLLDGELLVDDKTLHPGDYLRSEPGSSDDRVWSETGCTCVLLASTRDALG